jgi:hypothetical protein
MQAMYVFGNLIFRYQSALFSRLGYVSLSIVLPDRDERGGTSQQGIHMKALRTTICAGSLVAAGGLVGCNESNVLAGAQA